MSRPDEGPLKQEVVEEMELRRKMKNVIVPTKDAEVRAMLRKMEEPITLFGEREMERADRLRKLIATSEEHVAKLVESEEEKEEGEDQELAEAPPSTNELFYTEGPPELEQARLGIASFSLERAARRLENARDDVTTAHEAEKAERDQALASVVNNSSEIADERPVSTCQFSPCGGLLLTGAWSGKVKLWSISEGKQESSIQAHEDRITGVAWHPEASVSGSEKLSFATGASDGRAKLWSLGGASLGTLEGHTDRLGRIAFHPMGRYLASASFDRTWRMWDVETQACLQEQEGHSRAVYTVVFQCDGSLAASGGLDSVGRLWDLRTGKNILLLEGHMKPILAMDFSPNGYYIATGSEDNTARIYDLRKKEALAILPGHTSLVSQVRFEPVSGSYLLTCGYDQVSKLWSAPHFRLTKTLVGHEGKVMGGDISCTGTFTIATVGFDRTMKIFAPDVSLDDDAMEL